MSDLRPSKLLCIAVAMLAGCTSGTTTPDAGDDATISDTGVGADVGTDAGPPAPMVMTTNGPIIGTRNPGVQGFQGIPYAAPPVGALRWRPPATPTPWTAPIYATGHPRACPQIVSGLHLGEENCLFVNVHTPDPLPANAPVMVWIHGGAFVLGEGLQTDLGTSGDLLAKETGVVVVSMNYRLGQLGFLAHPALDAESTDHVSGNYGFLDQVAALHWVHDNIARFGGDPANVTIFGESAGGESVCAHLVAPASRGLFQRAIVESGLCGTLQPSLATGETQGASFAHALGCDTGDVAACMRAATTEAVIAALPPPDAVIGGGPGNGNWGPVVDGHVFAASWIDTIDAGGAANVPIMIGWNQDEGTIFLALLESNGSPPIDATNYRDSVASIVGPTYADMIVAQYPPSAFGGDAHAAAARALGDGALICPTRRAAIGLAAHQPVYEYFFTFPDAHFLLPASFPLGAFHSAEIQFVFGHPMGPTRFDADGIALHHAVAGYWTRFASQDGDPNGAGAVTWPAYDATSGARLVLDRTIVAGTDDYDAICAFWATVPLP